MKARLLPWLQCPSCSGQLKVNEAVERDGEIERGRLTCGRHEYPIRNFIPRFVPEENYAANFGLQWERLGRTQIDSYAGNTISRDRFLATTRWSTETLRDKVVLDAGCGGGRFAEIAVSLGAEVVALDFSAAADACQANLAFARERLHVVQADIARSPLRAGSLDAAYCMGVLQHTPDPAASFRGVASTVKAGGDVVVDSYQKGLYRYLNSIYWYRPLLKHVPPPVLFKLVKSVVELVHPIKHRMMSAADGHPALALLTCMVIPINTHQHQFPFLTHDQALAWSILNTFDAYSPRYDQPQSPDSLRGIAAAAGLLDIEIFSEPGRGDGTALVCKGRSPAKDALREPRVA